MANKKGPLGKVETFYIDEQIKSGKQIEEIATDLNRPQSIVQSYLTKAKKNASKNTSSITANDQFVRQNGATIMTQNASTLIDEKRKFSKTSTKNKNCITKIKND